MTATAAKTQLNTDDLRRLTEEQDVRRFGVDDEIDGGELLPELRCKVTQFFA